MIELRSVLEQELLHIHPRVYHQRSVKDKFPYVLYNLSPGFVLDDQEVFDLDIDIWDNKDDTTDLETLASEIWNQFNRYRYLDENIQFSIYRGSRSPLIDNKERNIKQRQLIFQLRYFDRRI